MKNSNFGRLVRLLASACAPVLSLILATMLFSVAAPQRAEAAGTCTINWGTVAYRSVNNTYVMSQSVNSATLAACDPRYPAVDSGVASPTSGTSVNGGTWSAVTNAADNTLTYTPPAGRIGADSFTMYFCNDAGCSGAGRLTATVNINIAAPTLSLTTSLPGGTQGTAYSQTLTASGGTGPYTFGLVAGTLPPGLSLGAVTNTNATTSTVPLAGTPTTGGVYNFTIRATDSSTGTGPVFIDQTYTVSITALPPTVTAVNPTAGPTAGGTTVIITGTNLTAASAVTFGATAATGVTVNSATQITATAPAGTGTVNVRVTTTGGTSATGAGNQYTYVAAPTVTAISPTSGPTGGGTTVTITGANLSGATAVTFGATPATGFTVNSATQITATAPAGSAGTIDVRVTTLGGTSATNASDQFTYRAPPTVTSVSPTAGPTTGGTTVTITGTNFTGLTAVTFGATPATGFTFNSATSITATAPAGTGTVDIRVTTAGGTSATSAADQFTYVAAPTVTSVSPTAGPTTGGTAVTITGTNFSGATAVTFGATSATGITVVSATQITATAPAGSAGTVNVRVTTAGGTSAPAAGNQFTFITPGGVSITGVPASLAVGQTATVTVTPSMAPPSGSLTISLAVSGTGGATTNLNTLIFTTATAQTFTITAAAPLGSNTIAYSLSGASAPFFTTPSSNAVTVVSAAPTVTSVSPTSGPASGGTTVTITGTSFTGATAVTFGATSATGITVNSATSITATAPAGTGTVDVRVTTPGGTSATSAADQFTYVAAPTVTSISPTAGPTTGGTTVILTGTGFSGATAVTFGATPATGFTVNSATQVTATAPAGTGTVDIRVTTVGGTSATSAADQFTYVAAPTVTSISPTAGPTTGGTTVTITGSGFAAAAGTGAVKFGATNATYTINSNTQITATAPAGVGTVDVTVTTVGGTSATSAADQYTYVAAPTVTSVSPTAGPTTGGTTVIISGSGFSGATAVTFGATPATGFTVNSATQITAMAPAGTGTVDIRVTTIGGTSATSAADQFTYVAAPTVTSIAPTSGPTSGGTTVTITGTNLSGATAVTFGATPATGFTVNSATQITATAPAGTGTIDIRVTTSGGTSATSAADQFTYIAAPTVTSVSPTAGPATGGTTVTITGTNFTGVTAVTFGATPATGFTFNSATSITATAPAGTGTVDIRITTGGGTSATSAADQFTYVAAPTVTSVSPTAGPTTGGTAVTITGTNFSGATAVTFGATSATGITVVNATTITATAPAGTGTVNVRVTTTGGVSATAAGNQFTYVAAPTVSSITPTSGPTSGGTTVIITGANLSGATSVVFGATPATGFTVNSATQITATAPAGTGTIDVRVTTLGGTSATSAADQFTYVGAPTVTSVSPTSGPTSGGTTVVITGSRLSGATAVTFGATPATGFTVNSATQITATAPAGTGTVDIRITTVGGTSATSAADQFTYVAAPVATDLSGVNVGFNTATAIDLSGSITGSHTSLAIATAPSHGTTSVAGDVVTYTPAANYAGTDSFTYSVTGVGGTSNTATVSLTVSQGAQTITFNALADASLSASPLTLAATADSGLTVSFVSTTTTICTVSGTSLTLLQTGTCTIRAEQAGDSTWSAAPPVLRSFAVTPATLDITSGAATGLVVGDSYSQTNTASGGVVPYTYRLLAGAFAPGTTLDPNTGTVSGTPIVAGTFSYMIRATDDQPLTVDTSVITVTIAKGSQTISITSTAPSAVVAGPDYVVTASATSGLGVTITLDGSSTGCTISGATVSFTAPGTCVINANQSGDSNWNAAAQVQQSFTVIANPPIAADVSGVAVAYDSAGTAIDLAGSLTGGAHSSIAIGTAAAHGTTSIAGDVVTYTPATGYYGADSFTYTATGPGGTSNVATVTLTVATPAAPVAVDKSGVAVPWNSPGTAIDLSTSITGVRSSIAIATAPTHGTVSVAGEVVTYIPAAGYYGADSFTFTATGPGGTSNVATVSLTVANPPAPMAANVSGVAVPYGSPGTAIDLSASVTGVHSSLAIDTAPAHGTTSIAGNVVTYTPAAGYYGADSFTYTATGPGGTSAPATVSLTVATPAAPTAANVNAGTVPFASTGVAIALQPAGVYTSLSVATGPAHGTVTISGTTATYVPTADYYGPDSFTYTATGPGGTSAPATVSLTVATPPPPVVTPPTDPVVVPPSTGGGSQPVTVNLDAQAAGEVDGFRITVTAQHGSAVITQAAAQAQLSGAGGPQRAPGDYQLVYTPAANFMGTDTVTVVAYGPGGDSSPLTFTFQVAGKAPDLSGTTPSNGSVTFTPTTTLVGGPFQGLRITRAPAFGTATVSGLSIVFTPGVANGGSTSLDYVIDLPFGASAAGRIDLVSSLVPGAQALTANTVQGRPVTVRISNTPGGPFTGAAVVSVSPTTAGTVTIAGTGGVYDLTFTPTGTFSGAATVTFSLTNASGTANGTVAVTVEARPDPGIDPEVRGVATSQVTTARRFADAQINNFQRRLQDLHDGTNSSSNGVSLNLGGSMDDDRDPRQALRRQLGQDDRLDPGALGDSRDREMLGLDLWSGQPSANTAGIGGDRLNMAGGQPSSASGGGSVGFWTSGSIDWGRQDADGLRDSRFTTQGVTAGLDVRISDQLILGGGLGYGEDKTKIGDNGSVSNGQAVTGALYASWRPADAFYIDGVLGYANLDFDSRRWVTGLAGQPDGYADGTRSGEVRFVSATFGRVTTSEGFTSDLYARLDARDITLDGFTETGGGLSSLIWSEVDQSSLSANLGASWRWVVDSRRYGIVVPSARIEWSHEFEDIGDQAVRYADWAASPSYLVPLTAWSRNSLNFDLDAEWSLTDRLVLGVGYRGALGDASTSHGAQIRVKYGW